MRKTVFEILMMDCPSEEQMIRMKLENIEELKDLVFDIPNRILEVYHEGGYDSFEYKIHDLKLNSRVIESQTVEYKLADKEDSNQQRVLWQVLIINFVFFIIEMFYGWYSMSMGLIADSLDMLADSVVYGLSLLAVGTSILRKKRIAKLSGYIQMILAGLGLLEVIRRFLGYEELPIFQTMIIVSFLALIANSVSLIIMQKSKSNEPHIQASKIFTSNDIVINAGVIVAGVLVYFTSSKFPDLIIGGVIFVIVFNGALRILKLSKD